MLFKGARRKHPFVQLKIFFSLAGVQIPMVEKFKLKLKFRFYPVKISKLCGIIPYEPAYKVQAQYGESWMESMFEENEPKNRNLFGQPSGKYDY